MCDNASEKLITIHTKLPSGVRVTVERPVHLAYDEQGVRVIELYPPAQEPRPERREAQG